MKKRKKLRITLLVIVVTALTFSVFAGGAALTARYRTTIVRTYDQYYNKYHRQVQRYIDTIVEEINHNIELASQKDKK